MGICSNAEEAKPRPRAPAPQVLQRWPTTSTTAASACAVGSSAAKAAVKTHVFSQNSAGYPPEQLDQACNSPQYEYVDDQRLGKSTFSISLACLTNDYDYLEDSGAQTCPQTKQGQLDKVKSFACMLNGTY